MEFGNIYKIQIFCRHHSHLFRNNIFVIETLKILVLLNKTGKHAQSWKNVCDFMAMLETFVMSLYLEFF